ncbi:cytochrome P450 [Podospora didyma]|uniref:Cytochrome P450 n=1 Tax=Podospora didyma TaxID=330526 RepID=A0AAE0U422_9PEZI|nr:cytochrome P450 [Podospora didyma]
MVIEAVLLLLCAGAVYCARAWIRLRHVPGPPLAGWSPLWMIRKLLGGRANEELHRVSELYGPLVRIGPNDLLCTDPDTLRRIAGARSLYTKGAFYESGRIIPGYDNVVSQRDEAKHKTLRAKMMAAYNGRENGNTTDTSFESGVDRQLLQLIALIDTKYISDHGTLRPFDLSAKSQFFSLDVISDMSFGSPFGFLTEDRDLYQFLEINDGAVPIMNVFQAMPWLTNAVQRWPLRLALPNDGDNIGLGRLMGLSKSYVEERLRPGSKAGQDMLQGFINGGMSYDELVQHMFVQIVAGSITTATAIRHTLLAVISTPTAYATLQREIDSRMMMGLISSPIITDAEALQFPYLQAVVREGLRMWPPTTGLGSKTVPRGGDVLCGFHVPEGTQISHNFAGLMRLKDVWGEDADVFRPERWLPVPGKDGEHERLRIMGQVLDLDFGSGKYQCLGKRIALMELNKIFVELMRRYDFAIINPQNPIKSWSGIFWIAGDLWLRVTNRQ